MSIVPFPLMGLEPILEEAVVAACADKIDLTKAQQLIRAAWNAGISDAIDEMDSLATRLSRDIGSLSEHVRKHTIRYAEVDVDRATMSDDARLLYDALCRDRGLLLYLIRHLEFRSQYQFADPIETSEVNVSDQVRQMTAKLKLLIQSGADADTLLEVLDAH